jgi:hypothetical protein
MAVQLASIGLTAIPLLLLLLQVCLPASMATMRLSLVGL